MSGKFDFFRVDDMALLEIDRLKAACLVMNEHLKDRDAKNYVIVYRVRGDLEWELLPGTPSWDWYGCDYWLVANLEQQELVDQLTKLDQLQSLNFYTKSPMSVTGRFIRVNSYGKIERYSGTLSPFEGVNWRWDTPASHYPRALIRYAYTKEQLDRVSWFFGWRLWVGLDCNIYLSSGQNLINKNIGVKPDDLFEANGYSLLTQEQLDWLMSNVQ